MLKKNSLLISIFYNINLAVSMMLENKLDEYEELRVFIC